MHIADRPQAAPAYGLQAVLLQYSSQPRSAVLLGTRTPCNSRLPTGRSTGVPGQEYPEYCRARTPAVVTPQPRVTTGYQQRTRTGASARCHDTNLNR